MTANQGPEIPREQIEVLGDYGDRLKYFNGLIALGGIDTGQIPIILKGMFVLDMDIPRMLHRARQAELQDPIPICAFQMSEHSFCLRQWHHNGEHLPI